MLKNIYFLLIIILSTSVFADKTRNTYFNQPLFNYAIHKNQLPQGNYQLVRSYKKTTQLLFSSQWQIRRLYIDRDNRQVSSIYSSGMASYQQTFIGPRPIKQDTFNRLIKQTLIHGDLAKLTTHKYYGLKDLLHMVKTGQAELTITGSILTIKATTDNRSKVTLMRLDYIFNTLIFNHYFSNNENRLKPIPEIRYRSGNVKPVVITETTDTEIIRILKDYALEFINIRKK